MIAQCLLRNGNVELVAFVSVQWAATGIRLTRNDGTAWQVVKVFTQFDLCYFADRQGRSTIATAIGPRQWRVHNE